MFFLIKVFLPFYVQTAWSTTSHMLTNIRVFQVYDFRLFEDGDVRILSLPTLLPKELKVINCLILLL
jgi:hypothetical protein